MSTEYRALLAMIDRRDVSFKSAIFTLTACSIGASRETKDLLIKVHQHLLEETLTDTHMFDMDDFSPIISGKYQSCDIEYDEYPDQCFYWIDGEPYADIHCKDKLTGINSWRFM